jgi:hypothetical protein
LRLFFGPYLWSLLAEAHRKPISQAATVVKIKWILWVDRRLRLRYYDHAEDAKRAQCEREYYWNLCLLKNARFAGTRSGQ